ncbi:GNAT family N-acetyltransferase [Geomonas paludis]|uniref:Acetyltransferase n=1 Tax=Geomonas paludis TaxID=2740185 RepID=A0A6V8N0J8_9BACT|nr:GNAT family N-acetyltransferase [Geomonas paludis]UPU36778.1 GNAT family N-acetyltransferase [Geomonas paludis]GFO66046.1 acetyltransferase [Geomonas paludis]
MQLEVIDNENGLLELGPEWEALERRSPVHLFQNHRLLADWYLCAGKASGAVPAVVVGREAGELRAVFPGCIIAKGGVRILTWLGGFFIVDYGDVLIDPACSAPVAEFLREALRLLKKECGYHVGYFHNMRHDALAYPYFNREFRFFRGDVAPFIELQGGFEAYLDSLKRFRKKQKSDTLRQIKRLEELGELAFTIVPGVEPRSQEVLEAFLEQKRWRFQVSGVHGVLFKPGYEEFYREEVRRNPNVHLCCLTLNGEVIATHLGYLYKNRLYFVMPTYDHRYGKYSPGRVLTYYLIRHCFEQGVELFDFCIGPEEYKYEWTDRDVPITSFVSDDIAGRLFLGIKKAKIKADELLKRIKGVKG